LNDIYVTGHRNPDTDAIVAAMAYANLRNALGDREYKAIRIGPINAPCSTASGLSRRCLSRPCAHR